MPTKKSAKRPKAPVTRGGPITPKEATPRPMTVRIWTKPFEFDSYDYDDFDTYMNEHADSICIVIVNALDQAEAAFKALGAWRAKFPKGTMYGLFIEAKTKNEVIYVP